MKKATEILDRITSRPVFYFVTSFLIAIAILWVILQVMATFNDGVHTILPTAAALEMTSSGLQAVVGNAVVGASAIVALVVAVAALRASEQSNRLAEHSNELSNPDYDLSHAAYSSYRKYGFLIGSLVADVRRSKHERDLFLYGDSKADLEAQVGQSSQSVKILEELRELLFDTAFSMASLEAARCLDVERGTAGMRTEQHNLRKAFVGLNAALESHIHEVKNTAALDERITLTLAQANLLDRQIREGIRAVVSANGKPESGGDGGQLLSYLQRWMGAIEPIETGADLQTAARSRAFSGEELLSHGKRLRGARELLSDRFKAIFLGRKSRGATFEEDPDEIGVHAAIRVAALCGDHSTILDLESEAARLAKEAGWDPVHVVVNNIGCLPVAPAKTSNYFFIYRVTRRTLPFIFQQGALNEYVRGCVFVDGLRTADLTWAEDELEKKASSSRDEKLSDNETSHVDRSGIDDLVALLSDKAWKDALKVRETGGRDISVKRDSPALSPRRAPAGEGSSERVHDHASSLKLLWVGLDYRRLAVEPPTRLGDFTRELHSIFGWDHNIALSDEVRHLTDL